MARLFAAAALVAALAVSCDASIALQANRFWGQCVSINALSSGVDGLRLSPVAENPRASNQLAVKDFICGGYPCQKIRSCGKTVAQCQELLPCNGAEEQCYEIMIIGCGGLPSGYDGNNDGTADVDQTTAKSIVMASGGYATVFDPSDKMSLDAADSTGVENVLTETGDPYHLPLGAVSFSASNARTAKLNSIRIFLDPLRQSRCDTKRDILMDNGDGRWIWVGPSLEADYYNDNYCRIKIKITDNGEWDSDPAQGVIAGRFALGTLKTQGSGIDD